MPDVHLNWRYLESIGKSHTQVLYTSKLFQEVVKDVVDMTTVLYTSFGGHAISVSSNHRRIKSQLTGGHAPAPFFLEHNTLSGVLFISCVIPGRSIYFFFLFIWYNELQTFCPRSHIIIYDLLKSNSMEFKFKFKKRWRSIFFVRMNEWVVSNGVISRGMGSLELICRMIEYASSSSCSSELSGNIWNAFYCAKTLAPFIFFFRHLKGRKGNKIKEFSLVVYSALEISK